MTYQYGLLDTPSITSDYSWIRDEISLYQTDTLDALNQGDKYIAFLIPRIVLPLIKSLKINGTNAEYTKTDIIKDGIYYELLITEDAVSTDSATITMQFEIGIESGGSPSGNIEVKDDQYDDGYNVSTIQFNNAKVEVDTHDNKQGNITPQINISETGGNQTTVKGASFRSTSTTWKFQKKQKEKLIYQ